MNLQFDDGVL